MEKIFILIPWFHPAFKAGGPIRSICNMVDRMGDERVQFSIICSNKDLDGTVLDTVPFDQWVKYSTNARVWYSSDDQIMSVLKKEIQEQKPESVFIVGLYDWNYNTRPLLFLKNLRKIVSIRDRKSVV